MTLSQLAKSLTKAQREAMQPDLIARIEAAQP